MRRSGGEGRTEAVDESEEGLEEGRASLDGCSEAYFTRAGDEEGAVNIKDYRSDGWKRFEDCLGLGRDGGERVAFFSNGLEERRHEVGSGIKFEEEKGVTGLGRRGAIVGWGSIRVWREGGRREFFPKLKGDGSNSFEVRKKRR